MGETQAREARAQRGAAERRRQAAAARGRRRSGSQAREARAQRGAAERRRRREGFTFLELMLVVGLIALLGGLLVRGIPRALPFQIRSASRVLSAELQFAAQRAITTGTPHAWVVDLDAQAFRVEYEPLLESAKSDEALPQVGKLDLRPPETRAEPEPVDGRAGDWRSLDEEDVRIALVRVGDREWSEGVTRVAFAPDGGADPAELWLDDGTGREMRIRIYPFTGEIRVDEDPDA
jgi:type II secretory pathway pseudopilin PulG